MNSNQQASQKCSAGSHVISYFGRKLEHRLGTGDRVCGGFILQSSVTVCVLLLFGSPRAELKPSSRARAAYRRVWSVLCVRRGTGCGRATSGFRHSTVRRSAL
ncbi:hypothetical protein PDJAM_G00015550 [Pangasius djambal]|uniref:Uncharacterized protein n=1 Tax=Pangasius djambal TaxID=1691987 RepID=A0ACC5YLL9_9TELE|nr:hypothetical protein [Pangasius djambal]